MGRCHDRAKEHFKEGIVKCVEAAVRGQVKGLESWLYQGGGEKKDGVKGRFSQQRGIFQTLVTHLSAPYFFHF